MALFYDLAIEKDFKIHTQAEGRERALRGLIRKHQRPIACSSTLHMTYTVRPLSVSSD